MARLDAIREQQSSNKNSRNKIREKLKALQDNIQKKVCPFFSYCNCLVMLQHYCICRQNEELQSSRSKAPFKTVAEIDAHIK
jgi:DNA repair exonuclease SbcCD ATPase subunit